MLLKNKNVLITGASRGIGRAIALLFAQNGANIVINYKYNTGKAEELLENLNKYNSKSTLYQADVGNASDVKLLADFVIEKYGSLDILINNAGSIIRPSDFKNISEIEWNANIDTNLKSVFLCTTYFAPLFNPSKLSCILNISSIFGPFIPSPGVIAYGAAKAGILSLTKSFAKALCPNIRVNCICPGFIDTDLTASSNPSFLEKEINSTLLKRIGKPEEIAELALFLVSEKSSYITGQAICIDGGYSLR